MAGDRHALGYEHVDDDPDVPVLIETMQATAAWEATRRLRAWERARLGLRGNERILDVGCGLGDALLGLAQDLGERGEAVGVDRSSEMVAAARRRPRDARCRVRFSVGDAVALDEPDGAYDVVRAERTLQWIPDTTAAVDEMVRVLRPGGLLSLIDTDWSTFTIDVGDDAVSSRVRDGMQRERRRPARIGARLHHLLGAHGLEIVDRTQATQRWAAWDPDGSPAPDGCFSMRSLADDLIDVGALAPDAREDFIARIHDAARRGRFTMALTMHAVAGRAAAPQEAVRQQYADDRNLAARQRLWRISRSEPAFDLNRWSVELLGARVGDRVLDVGCGNGHPLALLQEAGCTAIGLDRSVGMLQGMPTRRACAADAQALPFPDSTFDAAAAFMMLYHVPDRRAAARELRRVVRPGGTVVATTLSERNQPELRALVEDAVGGGWTWSRPSESAFPLERGAEILGVAFESVEVVRAPERRISVTDPGAMADYVASTRDHHEPTLPGRRWDEVVDAVRAATERAIADHGALVLTARLGALVCR